MIKTKSGNYDVPHNVLETPASLSSDDRRTASAWYQFIRVWKIETEHIPRVGWRVSQQNYIILGKKTSLEHDTQNVFVVQTMTTPDSCRYRPHEVLAAIQALPLEYRLKLDAIRCDRQLGGRSSMPTTLYPTGFYGQRLAQRDHIARACLALQTALKKQ
jgi:hypothetical protein